MFPRNLRKRVNNSIKKVRNYFYKRIRRRLNAPVDQFYNTTLHLAVQQGNKRKVEALLRMGAHVNSNNWENATPLHIAVGYGHPNIIGLLVGHGADIEAVRNDGYRPIHLIKESTKKLHCLRELLKYGADINSKTFTGNNILQLIIKSDNKDITLVKKLLHYGANVNNVDFFQNNCLHIVANNPAIPRGKAKIISKYLIDYGIDVNAKNLLGDTPLHEAVAGDNDDLVSLLLRCGARMDIRNDDKLSPFELAVDNSYAACLLLMMKYVVISKHRGIPVNRSIIDKIDFDKELKSVYRKLNFELILLKDRKVFNCTIYDILCRKVDNIVRNYELDPYAELSKPYVRHSNFHREIVETWNEVKRNMCFTNGRLDFCTSSPTYLVSRNILLND